ncbi:hypothetical protein [Vibrio mediterranei]|uniref:hypothetical protein n=1 Tax=Vibrio mediterranei TaxID=689 RepID=UPI004067FA79
MKSEITEAIQENIILWLAYAKLEKITYSEAEQRIEAYYLGLQEVLDINQLSTIIPFFSDARAYITAKTGQAPSSLFSPMGHTREAEEMLTTKGEVIEDLGKNLQLNARRFKADI